MRNSVLLLACAKPVLALAVLTLAPFCIATSLDGYRTLSATGRYTMRNGYTGDLTLLAKTSQPAAPLGPLHTLPFGKAELPGTSCSATRSIDELRFDQRVPASASDLRLLPVSHALRSDSR